jgi:hypothetical protein
MKTLLLLLVLLLSTIVFVSGSGDPGMVLRKQREPGMYTLIYKPEKKSDLTMMVSDSLGTLLFKELIVESDGFMRSLNFKFLLPGEYSIDVIDLEGNKKTKKLDHRMLPPELNLTVL